MENNDYELEKQKFELEKQKLELEKQKLDFEKSKFDHKTSSVLPKRILEQLSQDSQEKNTRSSYLLALISAGVLAITPFLPWVESHVGGFGFSLSGSANGFECGHGYYILLFAIAALVLAFMKNRLVFIPGVLALIDGIAVVSHIGSNSISFMGASGGAGFAMGPVIVIISSLVLIASPFIKNVPKLKIGGQDSGKSFDIKSFFITYKFQLLVSLTALFILIPLIVHISLYTFVYFFIALIFFCSVPIILLKYLNFTKTYKLFFALPVYYLLDAIKGISYFNYEWTIGGNRGQHSSFIINFCDSFNNSESWFIYIFYPIIFASLIIEIIEQKKKEILPAWTNNYNFIFKPIVPMAALFIPFLSFFIYYSVTRHQITNEEARNFENLNSYYSGDWYFMNQDSSVIFKFTVPPVTTEERYNTGLLQAKFSYKMQKNDGHNMGEESFDTTIQYGTKLELPLKYKSGLEITSLKDSILSLKIKLSDGNLMQVKCVKNNTPFVLITKKKEIKSTAELIKKSIEQFNEINSSYDFTKKFTLVSGDCHDDGCTFAFQNSDEGETQYASQLPENSVKFENTEEGGTTVQKKFLNKQYLIKYHLKKVFHEESNSASLEMLISEMKMVR